MEHLFPHPAQPGPQYLVVVLLAGFLLFSSPPKNKKDQKFSVRKKINDVSPELASA